MDRLDVSLHGALSFVGYALVGALGTTAVALVLVNVLQPLQPVVYDAFYRRLGPWSATTAATILHFATVGVLAAGVPVLAVELHTGTRARPVAVGLLVVTTALVAVLLGSAALDVLGFLTVVLAYGVLVVLAFVGLTRVDASTRSTAAFAGSTPVLAFLLLLLAVGLGWGGGYDIVAEPVPEPDAGTAADFDDAPALRADLFAGQACDPSDDGVCRLSLRGYEHEAAAGRFLAANGVRCPFVNAPASNRYDRDASFVAEHDGEYYRVSCDAYGD